MKILLLIASVFFLAACGAAETTATLPILPPLVSTQVPTLSEITPAPTENTSPTTAPAQPTATPAAISIAAQNLQTPWEIAFLPDGGFW
jgi:glucose/arabinose dehydrogenase